MKKATLHIQRGVHCHNLCNKVKKKVRKHLTFENKKYKDAMDNDRYTAEDPFFWFYSEDPTTGTMYIPRGYFYFLRKQLKRAKQKFDIIDDTILFDKIDVEFQGELRDYQDDAVSAMSHYPNGVLEAATGAGKTVMGCGLIAVRKQPTLIIVHNKELLYQWQGAIKQFLNYDCGIIGDGKNDMKDITVGIINTVRNKDHLLYNKFGFIVVDECHRCPSKTFTETLTCFESKFTLGLSATPFRRDGLGKAIKAFIGPALYKVDLQTLQDMGAVLKPEITRILTNFNNYWKDPYSTMITKLTDNRDRNDLIARTTAHDLKQYGDAVLIVTDRVSHCNEIKEALKKYSIKSEILHGKLHTDERSNVISKIRNGEIKVTIATIQLIGEGFDLDSLSSICLTTPIKFSGRLLQAVGRILRPLKNGKNKTPRVYDFRDNKIHSLRKSGMIRDEIYKKQWG